MCNKLEFSQNQHVHLVLTNHGHLLHWMQNIVKHLVWMLPMNLIRAFDAKIKRRRRFNSIRDGNIMIVTDFCSFRIAGIRTAISLTYERGEIVWMQVIVLYIIYCCMMFGICFYYLLPNIKYIDIFNT